MTDEGEKRLRAFTAQVAIALANAKLFEDVQNMKNYTESMLESMSNGVITMDEDGKIVTCNAAGLRIMSVELVDVIGKPAENYFVDNNAWIMDKVRKVEETEEVEISMDATLEFGEKPLSVNTTVLPLYSSDERQKLDTHIIG